MNIFGFVVSYKIVVLAMVLVLAIWLLHRRILDWIEKKVFRIRAPKIFKNHFCYKPEKDSQLRDLQLISVVMPRLYGNASDLREAYKRESFLLARISQRAAPSNFDDARIELLSARADKEYCERRFYDAKRVAEYFEYNVPDKYQDYIRD